MGPSMLLGLGGGGDPGNGGAGGSGEEEVERHDPMFRAGPWRPHLRCESS